MSEAENNLAELREIFESYSSLKTSFQQDTLVQLLKQIQDKYGAVSKDTQALISDEFNIKSGVIQGIIKRFPSLTEYPYKHRIVVCFGQQCSSKNSEELWNQIKQELKNRPSNLFYLSKQYCFHKCGTAPNIKVDNDLYTNVSSEDIPKILDGYN